MRYLRELANFWQNFIFGDDWTIAIAVMWGLLLVAGFAAGQIMAWYVIPLVVAALLTSTVYRSVRPSAVKRSIWARHPTLLWIWLPLIATSVLPYPLGYLAQFGPTQVLAGLLLPVSCVFLLVVAAASVLSVFFRFHPLLTSLLAGLVAWLAINIFLPYVAQSAALLGVDSVSTAATICASAITATIVVIAIRLRVARYLPKT